MIFTALDAKALTTFQPLTTTELKEREQQGGFSATLEELARANSADDTPKGPQWWLEKILSPLKNLQPPASDYQLAKAENEARRGLGMAPNADTLFTQYYEEELQRMISAGNEPTPELLQAIRERVQERVEAEIKDWHEQRVENQHDLRLQQQLAEFEALPTADQQQFPDERENNDSPQQEKLFINPVALQMNSQSATDHETETLIDQIKQSHTELT